MESKILHVLVLSSQDKDPWIGPRSADKVMQLYPKASRIRLDAGASLVPLVYAPH